MFQSSQKWKLDTMFRINVAGSYSGNHRCKLLRAVLTRIFVTLFFSSVAFWKAEYSNWETSVPKCWRCIIGIFCFRWKFVRRHVAACHKVVTRLTATRAFIWYSILLCHNFCVIFWFLLLWRLQNISSFKPSSRLADVFPALYTTFPHRNCTMKQKKYVRREKIWTRLS